MIHAIILQLLLEFILEPKRKSGKLFASIQPPKQRRTWKPRISMMDKKTFWFAKCDDRVRRALVPSWGWLVTFWLICEFFLEWKCFLTFCFSSVKKFLKDLDWSWILAWSSYVTNCYDKFYKEEPVPVWNYFRIRESSAPVLPKQSESWRTASLLYFNNLWTPVVSMKEPTMSWWFYGRLFNSFPNKFEKHGYMPKSKSLILWELWLWVLRTTLITIDLFCYF